MPEGRSAPHSRPSQAEAEEAVRTLIRWAGDDPSRSGLVSTPSRVVRAFEEVYGGYQEDPIGLLASATSRAERGATMVCIRGIPFASHSEEEMLPVVGKAFVAYVPDTLMVGLSKLGRAVDALARRLQNQDDMAAGILTAINTVLQPRGAAAMLLSHHFCETMRRPPGPAAPRVVACYSGILRDDAAAQARFLALCFDQRTARAVGAEAKKTV